MGKIKRFIAGLILGATLLRPGMGEARHHMAEVQAAAISAPATFSDAAGKYVDIVGHHAWFKSAIDLKIALAELIHESDGDKAFERYCKQKFKCAEGSAAILVDNKVIIQDESLYELIKLMSKQQGYLSAKQNFSLITSLLTSKAKFEVKDPLKKAIKKLALKKELEESLKKGPEKSIGTEFKSVVSNLMETTVQPVFLDEVKAAKLKLPEGWILVVKKLKENRSFKRKNSQGKKSLELTIDMAIIHF